MFQLQFENGINLWNNKTVLGHIKPWIELEKGDILHPVFIKAENKFFLSIFIELRQILLWLV